MFLLAASPWDTIGLVGASLITLGVLIGLAVLTRFLAIRPLSKKDILIKRLPPASPGYYPKRKLLPVSKEPTDG